MTQDNLAAKPVANILIADGPTVRIVREEAARTGAASMASVARAMIQEAYTLRRHERATQPKQASASPDLVPAPNSP